MKFLNETRILTNGIGVYTKLRMDALTILGSALDAVEPKKAIYDKVKVEGDKLHVEGRSYDLTRFKRIFLVGGGKAGGERTHLRRPPPLNAVSANQCSAALVAR